MVARVERAKTRFAPTLSAIQPNIGAAIASPRGASRAMHFPLLMQRLMRHHARESKLLKLRTRHQRHNLERNITDQLLQDV